MHLSVSLLLPVLAALAVVRAQNSSGFCHSNSDCSSTKCSGGGSATCEAAGFGQSSGSCTCPNGLPGSQIQAPAKTTTPPQRPTTSPVFSSTPPSTLFGPTTFCQGLSPGGGNSCLTISAGCYATSPTYNYVPQTTCTALPASTNPVSTNSVPTIPASTYPVSTNPASSIPSTASVSTKLALTDSASTTSIFTNLASTDSAFTDIASTNPASSIPSTASVSTNLAPTDSAFTTSVSTNPASTDIASTKPPSSNPSTASASTNLAPTDPTSTSEESTTSPLLTSNPSTTTNPVAVTTDPETSQPLTTASTDPFGISTQGSTALSSHLTASSAQSTPTPGVSSGGGSAQTGSQTQTAGQTQTGEPSATASSSMPAAIIPSSISSQAASATSQISAASSAASALSSNPTDAATAQAAESAISSALQAAQAARDAAQDAATIALLTGLIGPLTTAEEAAAAAAAAPSIEAAASVAAALASAEAASAALEAATEAAGTDTCPVSKRWLGPGRRVHLFSRADNTFCLTYQEPIDEPLNKEEIPDTQDCVNKNGDTATYTRQQVLDALEQGARYKLGNQVAKPAKYPHKFGNTAGIDTVTTNPVCNGQEILEFPILRDGTVLNVGKNNRGVDVGTERVLFTLDAERNTQYCGTITHHSPDRIYDPIADEMRDPFTNC